MIRTREERQADRAWCSQFFEDEERGDGIVVGVAIGAFIWILFMALWGWL